MNNAISRDFGFFSLLRFAFPTVVMMIFMSLYTIVDGVFVARFVGTDALSSVNLVYPVISVVVALAVMFGTGGSAVVARQMGEGSHREAKESFTTIVLTAVGCGVAVSVLGLLFLEPLVRLLGAEGALVPLCKDYLRILLLFAPASVLQMLYQCFFVTAGKPGLGLGLTVGAGLANMVLDYVFIVPLNLGISGAALATAAGYLLPAVTGTVFFFGKRHALSFVRPRMRGRMLLESCTNGSSEMVTNLSGSVVTLLFNLSMMRLVGPDGVASITIVLYAQFLMTALFMGYSMGVAPVVSFNYGCGNRERLKKVYRISLITVITCSFLVFLTALLTAPPLAALFAAGNQAVDELAKQGLRLFAVSFLFAGLNIFASALFTALSNGKISAAISFLRTFVFIISGILLLPLALGVNGIWLAVPAAEVLTMIFSLVFLRKGRQRYGYA